MSIDNINKAYGFKYIIDKDYMFSKQDVTLFVARKIMGHWPTSLVTRISHW